MEVQVRWAAGGHELRYSQEVRRLRQTAAGSHASTRAQDPGGKAAAEIAVPDAAAGSTAVAQLEWWLPRVAMGRCLPTAASARWPRDADPRRGEQDDCLGRQSSPEGKRERHRNGQGRWHRWTQSLPTGTVSSQPDEGHITRSYASAEPQCGSAAKRRSNPAAQLRCELHAGARDTSGTVAGAAGQGL